MFTKNITNKVKECEFNLLCIIFKSPFLLSCFIYIALGVYLVNKEVTKNLRL